MEGIKEDGLINPEGLAKPIGACPPLGSYPCHSLTFGTKEAGVLACPRTVMTLVLLLG